MPNPGDRATLSRIARLSIVTLSLCAGLSVTNLNAQTLSNPLQYGGEPVSIDCKECDIKDVFRFISNVSGENIVLDPSVTGKMTLPIERIKLDALVDLVLRTNNLGSRTVSNFQLITRDPNPTTLVTGVEKRFSGELITVSMRGADLRDFFRFIANVSQQNFIVDPSVVGTATLELKDV